MTEGEFEALPYEERARILYGISLEGMHDEQFGDVEGPLGWNALVTADWGVRYWLTQDGDGRITYRPCTPMVMAEYERWKAREDEAMEALDDCEPQASPTSSCPQCRQANGPMGAIGSSTAYRCRGCGWTWVV